MVYNIASKKIRFNFVRHFFGQNEAANIHKKNQNVIFYAKFRHYYDIGERKLWPCLGMPYGSSGVGEG